jgi:hypothetical protein
MSYAKMNSRRLSSAFTFIYKFIFPIVWISGFGFGTLMLWVGSPPSEMKWMFLAFWAVGTSFILWGCACLKKVSLSKGSLCVSNFVREIVIPTNMIARVSENRWINIHPVTIHFRCPTEFGDSITFMPKMQFFMWRSHPVVAELMQIASEDKVPGVFS